jgi:Right handed beta helix region
MQTEKDERFRSESKKKTISNCFNLIWGISVRMSKSTLEKKFLAAVCISLCLSAATARARTVYLSPTGDDGAAFEHGAEFATLEGVKGGLSAGDTLFIRNGTYPGGVYFYELAGTAEEPIVFLGESLDAVIEGSYDKRDGLRIESSSHVALENFTVRQTERAGVSVRLSHHVTVRDCRFGDNKYWGILTSFADDIHLEGNECYGSKEEHGIYHANSGDRYVIRNNLVHGNAGNGIHLNGDPDMGGDGILGQGVVENNILYGNGMRGGGAINTCQVEDLLIRNNLIYKNYAAGITIYQYNGGPEHRCKRVVVTGNTIYFESRRGKACLNIQTTTEKVLVAGNIFVGGGNRGVIEVHTDYLPTIYSDYNIFWGARDDRYVDVVNRQYNLEQWQKDKKKDSRSRALDPMLVSIQQDDYRPVDSSAAIDAGMPLDSLRAKLVEMEGFDWMLAQLESLPYKDIEGNPRPAGLECDIGAYEKADDPAELYDFNLDGSLNVGDAIALFMLAAEDPVNRKYDINGDGSYSIVDLIALILIMV